MRIKSSEINFILEIGKYFCLQNSCMSHVTSLIKADFTGSIKIQYFPRLFFEKMT